LSELLIQRDKTFGKKRQSGENIFYARSSSNKSLAKISRGRGDPINNRNSSGSQNNYSYRGHGRRNNQGRESYIFQQGSNNFRRSQSKRPPNRNY
jgi:hypothetical protein